MIVVSPKNVFFIIRLLVASRLTDCFCRNTKLSTNCSACDVSIAIISVPFFCSFRSSSRRRKMMLFSSALTSSTVELSDVFPASWLHDHYCILNLRFSSSIFVCGWAFIIQSSRDYFFSSWIRKQLRGRKFRWLHNNWRLAWELSLILQWINLINCKTANGVLMMPRTHKSKVFSISFLFELC